MTSQVQDTIERRLTIKASIDRVYRGFINEFLKNTEDNLIAGEYAILDFGEYGRSTIHVVATEPFTYFAYRWVPGTCFEGDIYAKGCTLVELKLAETDAGTDLTLIESGFASLPSERYKESIENNTAGWDEELGNLVKFLEG
jgi:hypothetical protein